MTGGIDSTATTVAGVDAQSRRISESHEQDEQQTAEFVRQRSLEIIRSVGNENPFLSSEPGLDPNSPQFSPKAWLTALLNTSAQEPERYPRQDVGVSFRGLNVQGDKDSLTYQNDVLTWPAKFPKKLLGLLGNKQHGTPILNGFDGLVKSGEMLLVLGRPGSGVSTLLKTIAGVTKGLKVDTNSVVNYEGIPYETMRKNFRGEAIYQAEDDVHFALLNVAFTLEFAALMRAPQNRFPGVSRSAYAKHLRDVVMAMYGITHTASTKVGNDLVRGVSGGERKRVSIAEVTLSQSAVQCWDNSTRGLDAATAVDFTKSLRLSTEMTRSTTIAAMYQAAEDSYNTFDKVTLLYEGRQIYFGPIEQAKAYFVEMGYNCPHRQTTADFLTSLTNPAERTVRDGFQQKVPRTAAEFAEAWKKSPLYTELMQEVKMYEEAHPLNGKEVEKFLTVRQARQSSLMRAKSPYTVSVPLQIWYCVVRGYHRLMQDLMFFQFTVSQNQSVGLIVGSTFYNLPNNAESIGHRLSLLFFAVLFNALAASFEIIPLYASRPVTNKHARYALYHPFADMIANMIMEMPNKIASNIFLNVPLYFLANLRREPGPFFAFLLFGLVSTLVISNVLRTLGHVTRSVYQALAPYAVIVTAFVVYTGFVLPVRDMRGWLRWLEYLNPVSYAYQSLVINELGGRRFECNEFVPAYPDASGEQRTCGTRGGQPGSTFIEGNDYIRDVLGYNPDHMWRNLGIIIAFIVFTLAVYLLVVEYVDIDGAQADTLVYKRGTKNSPVVPTEPVVDEETGPATSAAERRDAALSQDSDPSSQEVETKPAAPTGGLFKPKSQLARSEAKVFQWKNLSYDITVEKENRRLLDDVFGWVKPGSLTALMGATGAGKTTLLDVLADRVSTGVIKGDITVNGFPRSDDFQSKTGYAKQQDIHLPTATVREALRFSAVLRQLEPSTKEEKYAYVEEIIKTLDMVRYADAIVGEPGFGLNAEQRKRLTIGVELAAKPELLLFLDEPTSGLDSQTAWAIGDLLRKLADQGQAILCTIHQPSALLFEQFDRMLLLQKGGKMVYFGDLGLDSRTMIDYFESNGGAKCEPHMNPAEWMLNVTGAGIGGSTETDWAQTWLNSKQRAERITEMEDLEKQVANADGTPKVREATATYATSFGTQFWYTLERVFVQYWRTPSYIWSKIAIVTAVSLFIGLSFENMTLSMQGVQNQTFALFLLLTLLVFMAYQTMPHFIVQRNIFEARERASRTYSWLCFMLVNIIVELPWTLLSAFLMYITWYYPIGMDGNAQVDQAERGFLVFLLLWTFMLFGSTFTNMIIAAIETAELGALAALGLYNGLLIFCGIIMPRSELPGFWQFMYRVSPLTYLVSGVLSAGLSGNEIECSEIELLRFEPPSNASCSEYMAPFMEVAGGRLVEGSGDLCYYCPLASTDAYLDNVEIYYGDRWRNFGLQFAYIAFNILAALAIYYLARVPKSGGGLFKRKSKKQ